MRDPTGCRSENDETMRAGWLAGKRNPVSGDPLDIATLDLPPGSVVSRHDKDLSSELHSCQVSAISLPTGLLPAARSSRGGPAHEWREPALPAPRLPQA